MANYFNTLSLREQLAQLGKCEFMDPAAFSDGVSVLRARNWWLSVVVHRDSIRA